MELFLYSFALLIFSAIGSFFYRMQLPWKKHLHLNYIQPFSSTLFFNFSRKLRRGLPYWSYWDEYRLLDIAVLYCCRTPMLQPHQRRNKVSYLEDFLYICNSLMLPGCYEYESLLQPLHSWGNLFIEQDKVAQCLFFILYFKIKSWIHFIGRITIPT